jgi:hypothetical protein
VAATTERRRARSRRRCQLLLAASLVVLAGVPVALRAAQPPPSVGTRPTGEAVGVPGEQPAAVAGQPPAVAGPPGAAVPRVATRPARLADRRAEPPPVPPARLSAPAVGIAAAVRAVGVEPGSSAMEIPEDVAVAGWYRFGPAPGEDGGVAIVTAHVDSARAGPGAFFRLRELDPGERVNVELADGRVLAYEVTGREQMAKGAVPSSRLFRRDGPPALALVTCGGDFDPATRHYRDNVVVWARPLDV